MRSWLVVTVFVLLALVAFGPAFDAPFDFDDREAIVENASIRSLGASLFPGAPRGSPVAGRPVVNLSFALNYATNRALGVAQTPESEGRAQTVVYHATNMLLHVAAALLLLAIVRRTVRDGRVPASIRESADGFAFVVAAIWLVLPIQTEAVDYVTQRSELLVSVCYLATLYAAIRALTAPRDVRWIVAAILVSVVGMLSKEVMVTAPIIVLLYDRVFFSESWRAVLESPRRRALHASLLATMLVAIAGALTRSRGHSVGFDGPISWQSYLYSQGWAIAHYVRLAAWPHRLAFDYGMSPVAGGRALPGIVLLSAAGILTLVAWTRPAWRWFAFLGAWFFLLLAPSSSVVPIQTEIAAERRVYLAIAAVVVLVVLGGWTLGRRLLVRRALVAATALVLIAAMTASAARSAKYRDLVGRWRDAVVATPNNGRAYDNLASALLRLEPPDIAGADSVLHRATVVDPSFAPAWFRQATIALSQRRLADAESLLVRAVTLDPHHGDAIQRLGQLMIVQRQPAKLVSYFRDVVRRGSNVDARINLGIGFLMQRQFDSATVYFQRAVDADSTRRDARQYLGVALVEQNRGADAIPHLEWLVHDRPESGVVLGALSLAYVQQGRNSDATRMADSAIANAGNTAGAYLFAGRAVSMVGDTADALEYLRQAVRLDPNDPESLSVLATLEARLGNRASAIQLFTRALVIAPDYTVARDGLARIQGRL